MTFVVSTQPVVVDASAAVEYLTDDQEWLLRWASWLATETMLLAPAHFGAEVANALLRGHGLPPADVNYRLDRLWATGVETADRGQRGLIAAIDLADRYRLSVYDAAYLSLALDVDGELATLDVALGVAATAEGVPVTR